MEYKDIFNLNLWLFLAGRRTITILAHINRAVYQYDAFDSSMTPFSHYRNPFIYTYRHTAFIGTLGTSLTEERENRLCQNRHRFYCDKKDFRESFEFGISYSAKTENRQNETDIAIEKFL